MNFFSSNTEAAQNFRDEVDIKAAKKFWLDQRACAVRPR